MHRIFNPCVIDIKVLDNAKSFTDVTNKRLRKLADLTQKSMTCASLQIELPDGQSAEIRG